MRTRRIAVVGLKDDAAHAFHSMLKIVDGRSTAAWSVSTPDDADVLMAGAGANEPVIERWARTDKPLISVHEGLDGRRMTQFTLQHPFRVMQLLGVLDEVERSLETAPAPIAMIGKKSPASPWAFAESLRLLSRRSGAGHRYSAVSLDAMLFVQDDLSAYHIAPAALAQLRKGNLKLPPLQLENAPMPNDFLRRPVFELAWFVGLHEPGGLAPWLDRHAAFRLRRWPDFGMVRGARAQLNLAAVLAKGAFTREQLAEATRQSLAAIDAFLNACSVAGVLISSPRLTHAGATPAPAPTRFGGLIRSLRRHLGMTE